MRAPEHRERTAWLPADIGESSGVAASRRHEGILWTHNDSNHEHLIYAVKLDGNLVGTFRVPNATNRDWEDIALGPCPDRDGACLYIADTGDNLARRASAAVYIVPEPDLTSADANRVDDSAPARRLDLRYEEGPQDVESIAVAPNGNVLLITKGRRAPVRTYIMSREQLLAGAETTLGVTANAGLDELRTSGRWVTGAAVSPGGTRVVVRTYFELFFYTLEAGGVLQPDGLKCSIGADEPQGEGVDFLDEDTVVLTSEALLGRPAPITLVRC